MCGIVGILLKTDALRPSLGKLATPMLECMGTRGPDSAGLAVFQNLLDEPQRRYSLRAQQPDFDWQHWQAGWPDPHLGTLEIQGTHASLISSYPVAQVHELLQQLSADVRLLATGRAIRLFKDEGHPIEISRRCAFPELQGTHAVGHTRMATESVVSPEHAHPFTAGEDFCLVHNGSLSNPYSVRRKLERRGIVFETDNDTEAGCRFLQWRMREGDSLEEAIHRSFRELDGFFTFLMATAGKLVLVRDGFSCKPAVVAETDEYVAVGSEFRSLAHLPGIANADVFEPFPEQIYSWHV